ncbi:sulfate reduction electron transfer complex DsrMKJOP subunit DsrJ [Desulfosporosinus sp. OT]|uniref:sulfate reduction electron transfer complex DsrMKJOP subunit DsrJ n=1 Tax=Desulfosporosinus sp. OT TaxID=913865 RepID=UPI000223AC0B|nr:sulfate reduction electron transfer complex DsrMKJOP subunit DsrJ [Desulfosporosinus sp. OT]EGW39648.1 putative Hdr-like menaquinol oxidoreductase cytochrome c subunit [Desulfosporosinus sp. OT]
MYKGGKIIVGLVIFLAFLTFPFFYNMGKANAGPENLDANLKQAADSQCVEPADYMRNNHMQLLNQWRQAYVRDGLTEYTNSQGKTFEINIDTCTKCHSTGAASNTSGVSNPAVNEVGVSNPAVNTSDQFCVSCHDYASVKPTCWSCHSEPGGATK